jgi:hypothetical protein
MRIAAAVGNATARRVETTNMKNHAMRIDAGMLVFTPDNGSVFAMRYNLFARLTDDRASLFLSSARLGLRSSRRI